MYGYRQCYIAGWVWFAMSSLLTGISVYSKTFIFYCVCRGLQGMATAMLVPCALAILGTVYRDGPRKNLAFSLYAAGAPIGFTLGGIFSGLIAELAWWPWIFWVTAFVCCGLAIIARFTVPDLPSQVSRNPGHLDEQQHSDANKKSWRHGFDWAGTASGVSGLILFNVAWNQAPVVGWSTTSTIAIVTIGFLLLIGFILIERRAQRPLIPVGRLSSDSLYVLATMALAWASFGVLVFYMVNFITRIRGASIISTASQFLPVPFTGLLASWLNSFLLSHRVSAADILAFSSIWFIAGNALLATMPVRQSYWLQMFWISVLAPFGMDLSFPSATLLISQIVPPGQQGIAASLIATVVYYSQSIGLGIAGTVQRYTADGNLLKGYRGATYTGVALSGLGFLVALYPVLGLRLRKGVER
jgi:MFS family permease